MRLRVLITGATGFVGQHLVRLLLSRNHEVYGTYFSTPTSSESGAKLVACDVRDATSVRAAINQTRPHRIYHLAAQSSPSLSIERSREVFETNFWGTYNILESVRQLAAKSRILVVGSGQCYGDAGHAKAISESAVFAPLNPYALSKAGADMLAGQYYFRFGLHVVRARPFNHTGPGQQRGFVCSDYACRIAAIDNGNEQPSLRVENAAARRDFTDVRDVVRAYELLIEKGEPGEAYNVASGHSVSVREIVSMLVSFSARPIRIFEVEDDRRRKVQSLRGSSAKLSRATGWQPSYNIHQTLRDLFEYWKKLSSVRCESETVRQPRSDLNLGRTQARARHVRGFKTVSEC